MAIPLYTTGSLSPTFVPAPPVGVAVKLPSAFALFKWFPTILREPLSASDTLSEATAPVKLPTRHCPPAGSRLQVRSPVLQGWDTIYSCDIIGSSDSSIKNVVPTDLKSIIDNSKIEKVICNGKTSGKYYEKYQMKYLGIKPDILPSTSPANAAYSLGKLVEIWKKSIIY